MTSQSFVATVTNVMSIANLAAVAFLALFCVNNKSDGPKHLIYFEKNPRLAGAAAELLAKARQRRPRSKSSDESSSERSQTLVDSQQHLRRPS
ncbi:unnamed protein product [Clavelina lepadiformis]|uniref:Secreted protein n=1 Tax=Clavelina lepadiformis TaxID=159417 RepID=A0ABP0F872_CLALP